MAEWLLILSQKESRAIALERKSVLLWREISEKFLKPLMSRILFK